MTPILEALEDPKVREVYIVAPGQSGKTEVLLNYLGKRFHFGPRVPTLVVTATERLARRFADQRLKTMIRGNTGLAALQEPGARDSTLETKLGGVAIRVAWAGSAAELASDSCGIVLFDERDRIQGNVNREGDPLRQAKARGKNYARFKMIVPSTPTIEDASPIQLLFDTGSMEMYEWRCPHCQFWFHPRISSLRWPKNATATEAEEHGAFHCPSCDQAIEEHHRLPMNERGRYRRYRRVDGGDYEPDPNPPPLGSIRSYWIHGFQATWTKFHEHAREFCTAYASHDQETIQATVNLWGGEVYRMRGSAPDWHQVFDLRRDYGRGQVDPDAQLVTVGVDVQRESLYFVVRAWGFNMSSWLLDNGQLHGETEYDDVWLKLDRVITKTYGMFPVHRVFVDSGYNPTPDNPDWARPDHQVYKYCQRHPGLVYPTKGYASQTKPLDMSLIDISVNGRTMRSGMRLWRIGLNFAKPWLYGRIGWPADAEDGFWAVHRDVDEDYCRQVVAEERVPLSSGKEIWRCPRNRPNHYFDAEICAYMAAYSLDAQNLPERALPPQQTLPGQGDPNGPKWGERMSRNAQI